MKIINFIEIIKIALKISMNFSYFVMIYNFFFLKMNGPQINIQRASPSNCSN